MVPCCLAHIYPGTSDTPGCVSCRSTGDTPCKGRSASGKLRHTAPVTAHATGLDDPARNSGYREVTDDADNHEHDIHPVARIQLEIRVSLHTLDVA